MESNVCDDPGRYHVAPRSGHGDVGYHSPFNGKGGREVARSRLCPPRPGCCPAEGNACARGPTQVVGVRS